MAFFRSTILALAITSAVFAQNVANPSALYNPAAMNSMMNPMANSMMNPMMMGGLGSQMSGYPLGQQQLMYGMNPYQTGMNSMMPGMIGMPGSTMMPGMQGSMMMPGMMTGMPGYPSMYGFPQQSQLGLGLGLGLGGLNGMMPGMPGSMMMPGMSSGYGMPSLAGGYPGYGSPLTGMSGLTQSPYGFPMGQQSMLGYPSPMGLSSPYIVRK